MAEDLQLSIVAVPEALSPSELRGEALASWMLDLADAILGRRERGTRSLHASWVIKELPVRGGDERSGLPVP
jgi:hypothetical protein